MQRSVLTLCLLGCLVASQLPAAALADKGNRDLATFNALFGGTAARYAGVRKWQPSLWLDGSWGVAGPLHIGAYFQWLGRSFPLDDPGFGGGGTVGIRANIKKLRIAGTFTGGYLRVPLPIGSEGAGTIGAFAGLGYGFLSWMGFEVRGRWMRYLRMSEGAPRDAWTIEAGFSFFVK